MIRLQDIRASLDTTPDDWRRLAAARMRIREADIRDIRLLRRSIDARDKRNLLLILSFEVTLADEAAVLKKRIPGVAAAGAAPAPALPAWRGKTRPVVVGFGPAGIFAGLALARMGARPLILERGKAVAERVSDVNALREDGRLNPESNVQFGEGGAGAFSDGKLTTGIKSPWIRVLLETLVDHGAPSDILIEQKPHIGTDLLRGVISSIRQEICRLGGEVLFSCRLQELLLRCGTVAGVRCTQDGQEREFRTDAVILAVGHSARDTVRTLYAQGMVMAQKPFAMGVRIEHPQALISQSQYGPRWRHPALGPASYKLAVKTPDGRGVYTFCMCPGGEVICAANEADGLAVNGMSLHSRSGANANAALLTGVRPEDFGSDHPLAGFALQKRFESLACRSGGGGFRAPAQRVEDFMLNRPSTAFGSVQPSYRPGVTAGDLRSCLPPWIVQNLQYGIAEMDRQLRGFAMPDAVLTGIESRSSSPVRMTRTQTGEADGIRGLFPAGEGAGYAGGIVSAAVDGIHAALNAAQRAGASPISQEVLQPCP